MYDKQTQTHNNQTNGVLCFHVLTNGKASNKTQPNHNVVLDRFKQFSNIRIAIIAPSKGGRTEMPV